MFPGHTVQPALMRLAIFEIKAADTPEIWLRSTAAHGMKLPLSRWVLSTAVDGLWKHAAFRDG